MATSWLESPLGRVKRSCSVRRTLASSLLIASSLSRSRKFLAERMRRINAQYLHRTRLRNEFQLLERQFQGALLVMSLHVGIELCRGEAAPDHVAFELGHVDAVGGEAAHRFVQRRRHVAHLEYEGGDDALLLAARPFRLARQDDE